MELARQYAKFTESYEAAMVQAKSINEAQSLGELSIRRDAFPYKPTAIDQYGLDFISAVDPFYVADIEKNLEWYLQKPEKEVLLNVNYPSRQEKDFLRHIERWQQEKNDLNYRRILQQLAAGSDDQLATHGMDINRYNSLSSTKRGLVVQEDA